MEMELERMFARKVEILVGHQSAEAILISITKMCYKTFYEIVRSRTFDTPSF
jgi:hypothetical protein